MKIVLYTNNGRNITINKVEFILHGLKETTFQFSDKKSVTYKNDDFWKLLIADNDYGEKVGR